MCFVGGWLAFLSSELCQSSLVNWDYFRVNLLNYRWRLLLVPNTFIFLMYGVPYAMFLLDFKNVGGLFGEEVADVFLGSDLMAF